MPRRKRYLRIGERRRIVRNTISRVMKDLPGASDRVIELGVRGQLARRYKGPVLLLLLKLVVPLLLEIMLSKKQSPNL